MSTRSISFTEHHDDLIEAKLNSGHYQNASEVVRDAMRAFEQREAEDRAKLEALRAAVGEGIAAYERGAYTEFASANDMTTALRKKRSAGKRR